MKYNLILVYDNNSVLVSNSDTTANWYEEFNDNIHLQYLEYRENGKKIKEFTRIGYYKHLAGEVK